MKGTSKEYGRLAQALHWLSSVLILVLWPLGFLMVRMSDVVSQARLYQIHVGIGLLVVILTVVRVIWHFMDEVPESPAGLTPFNAKLFLWTHNLLYIFLFVLAISGAAMLISSGLGLSPRNVLPELINDSLPRSAHSLLSKVFLLLLIAHIGGVVRYQLTKGNTLARMGVPISSPKEL